MAVILCYSTEFGSSGVQLRKSSWRQIHTICDINVLQKSSFSKYMTYGDTVGGFWEQIG